MIVMPGMVICIRETKLYKIIFLTLRNKKKLKKQTCINVSRNQTEHELMFKKLINQPGTVAYACNPFVRPRLVDYLRSGNLPDQHGKTPSLLKVQNYLGMMVHACNPSYSGG